MIRNVSKKSTLSRFSFSALSVCHPGHTRVKAMSENEDWETEFALEAYQEAKEEGLPATTPYEFYGLTEDPFHPILPLRVDVEERKKFFGHGRMTEFLKGFLKKILACYHAKFEMYEEFYRTNKEFPPGSIPNLIVCGPPRSGRTTICRYLVSVLNKPEILGRGAAILTSTNEWATIGTSITKGMQRWLDPVHIQEDGRGALTGLKVLFIDDADAGLDFLGDTHTQIQDLANGPVVLIPILTPIGYDFLAEYHCERDPEINRLFGLGSKVEARAPLTVWVRRWSSKELNKMLRNRLYITGGNLGPFSEQLLEQISRRSIGLPGEAIELAENIMRRSEHFELQACDESYLKFFMKQLGITIAEKILRGGLAERQVLLTSGFEVPASETDETITISGTRRDILEVILREIVLFDKREVRGEMLADPEEHNATQRVIDVKRSTLSYHLTNLVKEGVLTESRHGRSVGYSIRKPIKATLQMILSSSMMRVVM